MTSSQSIDVNLQAQIKHYEDALNPLLSPGQPYALLDYPDHSNVGDSAIYAGEVVFLDRFVGRKPSYVCSFYTYAQDVDKFCPEGPLLIHGGGNFGDIWPQHQDFRIALLKRYPDRKIIQLPQSIHFQEDAAREETARAIEVHKGFTLLVRDKPSFDYAQTHFQCPVILCPDGACNLETLSDPGPMNLPLLSMLRLDKESQYPEVRAYLEGLGTVDDWGKFDAGTKTEYRLQRYLFPYLPEMRVTMNYRETVFRRRAFKRVAYGASLLQRGELIVSDRLHVHIMSTLMRRRHVVLDNSYGKIGRYIEAWGGHDLVAQVSSLEELQEVLKTQGT